MNNLWNRAIYKIWAPMYDRFFNSGMFLNARRQVFEKTSFSEGQTILFVGVGTGADLELMDHTKLEITAIDFSPDMLQKAKDKFESSTMTFIEMDAQQLNFIDQSFDYVVGSLILSVVPHAEQCLREMVKVCKPNGKIIIFDKFIPKNQTLSFSKKLIRPLIKGLGTDIGLNFEQLYDKNKHQIEIEEDIPIMLGGMYRKIVLRRRWDNISKK